MRKLAGPAAAVLTLAVAAAGFVTPASAATAPKSAAMSSTKQADCAKQWKAEKKHTQTRKAFMATCQKA